MSSVMASVAAAVHPHQIEIQDFDVYDLIIDARSAREYSMDHLPRAVSLPAGPLRPSSRRMEDAAQSGDQINEPPAPWAGSRAASLHQQLQLRQLVCHLQPGALLLVYCSAGGRDSAIWARCLEDMGFCVDVLAGGWPVYRAWVQRGIEQLPRCLDLQGITAAPMGGLDVVVRQLVDEGEQVLLLDWVGADGGAPGFAWPSLRRTRQPRFETLLLDALRQVDASRTVWVGWCWPPSDALELPPAMTAALNRRPTMEIACTVATREQGWRRLLDSLQAEPSAKLRQDLCDLLWVDLERASQSAGIAPAVLAPLRDLIASSPHQAALQLATLFAVPPRVPADRTETLKVTLPVMTSEKAKSVSSALVQLRALSKLQVGQH
jgi:tRNA 2-selenouridine synthase